MTAFFEAALLVRLAELGTRHNSNALAFGTWHLFGLRTAAETLGPTG